MSKIQIHSKYYGFEIYYLGGSWHARDAKHGCMYTFVAKTLAEAKHGIRVSIGLWSVHARYSRSRNANMRRACRAWRRVWEGHTRHTAALQKRKSVR